MIERLKDLREDLDLSQDQIAQILNCSRSTYSRYENGNRIISPYDLLKLANFYDVSLDYIMGRVNFKFGHYIKK